ncbi:MAG: MFS transporter [Pacificimonas sp.]|jgi:Na+/melibiose symporter-like transporter|nr:MFS transporter [Pacificimonas sp.]
MAISLGRLIAYSGPGVPVAAMGLPLVAFLPPFYAGELGLDLALVGLIFFVVRALDVPFDPLVGHWADNTRTRLGRFKPWLLGGGILATLGVGLVFFPPEGIGPVYLFVALVLLYAGQSCINVPHTSWGATLSNSYTERSRIFSFWQGGHMLGLILALTLPAILSQLMGDAAPRAVQVMGAFTLVALPVTIILALVFVPRSRTASDHPRIGIAELKMVFAKPELRRLLAVDILFALAGGALGTLLRFFLEDSRGFTDTQSALMLLFFFIAGILALPLWLWLAKKIGKARTTAIACIYQLVAHVIGFFVYDGDQFLVSAIALSAAGIAFAAPTFLFRSILADHNDEAKAAGGNDRIGLLNAVLTTASKVGTALPVGILFPLLQLAGFDPSPDAVNDPESLFWLEAVWIGTLPLTLVPAALLMLTDRFDRARHAALRAGPVSPG